MISEQLRICTLQIKTKFFNLTFINAYAPKNKEDDIKEEFYQILEHTYNTTPSNDIKLILGDLNTKLGKNLITWEQYKVIAFMMSLMEMERG